MQRFLFTIDRISAWSGKITAWVILLMTLLVAFDITMRYLSKWGGETIRSIWFTYNFSYDMSYYLYGAVLHARGVRAVARSARAARLLPKLAGAGAGHRRFLLYLLAFLPWHPELVSFGAQWAGTLVDPEPLSPLERRRSSIR